MCIICVTKLFGLLLKKAKPDNDIDESKVEKIFKLEDRNDAEQLKQLLLRVPLEEAEVVGDIVVTQRKRLR